MVYTKSFWLLSSATCPSHASIFSLWLLDVFSLTGSYNVDLSSWSLAANQKSKKCQIVNSFKNIFKCSAMSLTIYVHTFICFCTFCTWLFRGNAKPPGLCFYELSGKISLPSAFVKCPFQAQSIQKCSQRNDCPLRLNILLFVSYCTLRAAHVLCRYSRRNG